jgi:DNA modification methylase
LKIFLDGDVIKTAVSIQSILRKYGIDTEHPAPFPTDIVILPILQTSNEGDDNIVLDPFLGTGSVGEVALKLNRKYVGYELNENFVEVQLKRFENLVLIFKIIPVLYRKSGNH